VTVETKDLADTVTAGGALPINIYGGSGDDTLGGALGPDYLEGGTGADTMTGGAGPDAFQARDGESETRITCQGADIGIFLDSLPLDPDSILFGCPPGRVFRH
jgi:Ca2+-binding RTX toxin-like protein